MIGGQDVGRVSRQGHPSKGPLPPAEHRTDERRHEPRVREGSIVPEPTELGAGPQVVAVVEHHRAAIEEPDHGLHVAGHRFVRSATVVIGPIHSQLRGFLERQAAGDVPAERVVRAGLVGDHVGREASLEQRREHVGGVSHQPDGDRLARGGRFLGPPRGVVDRVGLSIQIPRLDPALDPCGVHVHAERHALVHGDRQRLRAAHPAQPGGEGDPAPERPTEPLAGELSQRLVRALEDPLASDVDPRARGHLAVHGQAGRLQLPEGLPVGPLGNQHGVGDEHARHAGLGAEHPDRLAGLDQERLVVLQRPQRPNDLVEGLPAPRGLAGSAVDDELRGPLGDLGVQVVHQHAKGRLLGPALAGDRRASGGPNLGHGCHAHTISMASRPVARQPAERPAERRVSP